MLLTQQDQSEITVDTIQRASEIGTLDQLTNKVLDKAADNFYHDLRFGTFDSWNLSLIPGERSRLTVTNTIIPQVELPDGNNVINLHDAVKMLEADRCSLPSPNPQDSHAAAVRNSRAAVQDYGISEGKKSLASRYACQDALGLMKMSSCQSSLKVIERISTPLQGGTFAGMEIFAKVLNDSRYDAGIKLAALKLASRVESHSESASSYLDDLKTSFQTAGASSMNAEEMAWTTAGLIATAGPNLSLRLQLFPHTPDQSQKRIALEVLAKTLPILDQRSSVKGRLYSLPTEVSGSCNSGKSYHFWYSAYLARRAALETGNPEGAAASAFESEVFYQVLQRPKHDMINGDRMATSGMFSPASEVVRADLAYAAAGAHFGAKQATDRNSAPVNVDNLIAGLIKNAGQESPGVVDRFAIRIGGSLANKFVEWKNKFNPQRAFASSTLGGFRGKVNRDYLNFEKTPTQALCK